MEKTQNDGLMGDLLLFESEDKAYVVLMDGANPSGYNTYEQAKKDADSLTEKGHKNVTVRSLSGLIEELSKNDND